jgi:hypothetical protein
MAPVAANITGITPQHMAYDAKLAERRMGHRAGDQRRSRTNNKNPYYNPQGLPWIYGLIEY